MPAQELERIYSLSTTGLRGVIADIGQITVAFNEAAEAKAKLSDTKTSIGYDASQINGINGRLEELVNIQKDLINSLKNVGSVSSDVSGEIKDLNSQISNVSGNSNKLGSNLTQAASGLTRMQASFNNSGLKEYDSLINKLVSDLSVLNQLHQENKTKFQSQGSGNKELDDFVSIHEKSGFSFKDDKVMSGKAEVPALTERYRELKAAVVEVDITYEQYLKEQLELTSGANQLTSAIMALNRVFNPSIIREDVLAIGQLATEQTLAAKSADEWLQKQIELDAMQGEINAKRKQASYFISGQAAKDEQALLDKQMAYGEKYVAQLERENELLAERERVKRGNQELKGEAAASSIEQDQQNKRNKQDPEYLGNLKKEQQELRRKSEIEKNEAIITDEQTSHYYKLSAELNNLRIKYRMLTEEEWKDEAARKKMIADIQRLNGELVKIDKEIGNHSRNIGNYASMLQNAGPLLGQFVRQLVRGVGSLIIWGVLFDAIFKVGEAISTAIPGTEKYAEAQEKLKQANEDLVKSFEGVVEAIVKEQKALEIVGLYNDKIYGKNTGLRNVLDDQKAHEALVRAQGSLNGQTYVSDKKNLEESTKTRGKEIDQLTEKLKITTELIKITDESTKNIAAYEKINKEGGSLKYEDVIGNIKGLYNKSKLIPQEVKETLFEELGKLEKENRGKLFGNEKAANEALVKDILKIQKQTIVDDATIKEAINKTKSDQLTAEADFQTKHNQLIYSKNVELNEQLKQLDEQYRQLKEKEDVESIDKIVENTNKKYQILIDKNQKAAVDYMKTVSGVVPDKGSYDENGVLTNEYYKKEWESIKGNALVKKFGIIESDFLRNKKQEVNNERYEDAVKAYQEQINVGTLQSQSMSTLASFSAGYGGVDYSKISESLEKEKEYKKKQAQTQFYNETSKINDNDLVQQAQKILDAKLIQIDDEMYKKRLQIATEYFKRITEEADRNSENIISILDNETLKKINQVLAGTSWDKDYKIEKLGKKGIINKANEEIKQGKIDLPQSIKATQEASDNLNAAGEAQNYYASIGDKEHLAAAIDRVAESQKAYNRALADQLLLEGKITKAEHDKLVAEQKNTDYRQVLKDTMINVATSIANDYMQLLEKQDAYKQEVQRRSMEWNQKILSSENQSNNQRLQQDKAYYIAQLQASKDKMKTDKKRAETQAAIDYASAAISLIPIALKEGGLASVVIQEAGLAAIFLAKENMLKQAPVYGEGTGNSTHPGGLAWVGDKYEHELIISPNKPTLTNIAKGSTVIPFSKLGNMGSQLQAPSFQRYSSQDGNSQSYIAHENAIQGLYGIVGEMGKHLSNQRIVYEPDKATKADKKLFYKTHKA